AQAAGGLRWGRGAAGELLSHAARCDRADDHAGWVGGVAEARYRKGKV
ncbi:MAG: hypothetical protein AVDCRST_MAG05-2327, partial [uncultured Rubrobacteraceae bacterium]